MVVGRLSQGCGGLGLLSFVFTACCVPDTSVPRYTVDFLFVSRRIEPMDLRNGRKKMLCHK